jgi:hypothetical protein
VRCLGSRTAAAPWWSTITSSFPISIRTRWSCRLTRDGGPVYASFAERIDPDSENGVDATCWALAHHVTNVSLQQVRTTPSQITADQVDGLRRRIAVALGIR